MIREKNARSDERLQQRLKQKEEVRSPRERGKDGGRKEGGKQEGEEKDQADMKDVSTQQARGSGRQEEKHRDGLHGARLRN